MILALLLALTSPDAKPLVVERAEVRRLVSKENGVAYKLYVALPHGYDGKKRYPVVYALDADYSFLVVRNIADHLAERDHLRELIVVGIAYDGPPQYRLNRTRDYTPKFSPTGGYGPGTPASPSLLVAVLLVACDARVSDVAAQATSNQQPATKRHDRWYRARATDAPLPPPEAPRRTRGGRGSRDRTA